MRFCIKHFVRLCSEELPILDPIYEFGSFQVPSQEIFADLRPFFPGHTYIGCDMRQGPGVDQILNLHDIDLPDETAGSILSLDTLEHVEYPRKAMEECYRILKPNGVCVISSVLDFPIHDYPSDYWRFTPEGFKSLLQAFDTVLVESLGKPEFPHTVVGVGVKGALPEDVKERLLGKLSYWKRTSDIT